MKSLRSFITARSAQIWAMVFTCAAAIGFAGASACSTTPAAAKCDEAKCAAENKCIANEKGETACRLTCDNDTIYGTKPCPTDYFCKTAGTQNYCEKGPKTATWGKICNPIDDVATQCGPGFDCYTRFNADAQGICTKRDCKADTDCLAPSMYCATLNKPSLDGGARPVGETASVCLPRTQCSPCNSDADCPLDQNTPQSCVSDGTAKYCMRQCDNDDTCVQSASCQDKGGSKVCFPSSGSCKGDGTLCAGCVADKDCASGWCVQDPSNYSDERYCAGAADIAPCVYDECTLVRRGNSLLSDGSKDCESGWCLQADSFGAANDAGVASAPGVCAAAPTKEYMRDAGAPVNDAGVPVVASCRGANVPKGSYPFCVRGAGSKSYCVGWQQLPGGGQFWGCYSRARKE
jgi:hypothetical protein